MKKAIFVFLLAINITPANANEVGGWVKISADGTIISGTMVCTPDVCGDVNSSYSKLTLLPGERYVQITRADTTGNVAGPNVLAQSAPNKKVSAKLNPVTNLATVTTTTVEPLAPGVTVIKEAETTYSVEQSAPVTTIKTPVIKIQEPETIKENPAFIEWIDLINKMFITLFNNFSWAWDF